MSNHIEEKQPTEVLPCSVDFKLRVPAGETINPATSSVKVTDAAGADKTADMTQGSLSVSGTIVTIVVKGGTNLEDYTVTFLAVTTPAVYKFEDEVLLQVREKLPV